MKRTCLILVTALLGALWILPTTPVFSQATGCVGVGGVNTVPQVGINCPQQSIVPTYAATSVSLAPASTATDIACLTGSATRTIRLQRVTIGGIAGTAASFTFYVAKRTTVDTGGTQPTTIATGLPIAFALDSTFAAPTATVQAYTANPTINDTNWTTALANIIASATIFFQTASATATGEQLPTVVDFAAAAYASPPVIRGVAQQICISLNTSGQTVATPASGLLTVNWLWTENVQ